MRIAIITPVANEAMYIGKHVRDIEKTCFCGNIDWELFVVVDKASIDDTLLKVREIAADNPRVRCIWAPQNRSVVDAYLVGYAEAVAANHQIFIEMDSGGSHDPEAMKRILKEIESGYSVVYGSRFIKDGGFDGPLIRKLISRVGTWIANVFLGLSCTDGTGGYIATTRDAINHLLSNAIRSTGHFYQTELRYLLREFPSTEVAIIYKSSQSSIGSKTLLEAISLTVFYAVDRYLIRETK